jgi:hypothetical protein
MDNSIQPTNNPYVSHQSEGYSAVNEQAPQNFATPPINNASVPEQPATVAPIAVVRVLSPRGVEYVFLTIALFTGAASLTGDLISLLNGKTDFSVLAFPTAALVVSLPVFAWLFLRLKKAEFRNPSLKLDPSKRRSTQFIQITTFVICFFSGIGFLYSTYS